MKDTLIFGACGLVLAALIGLAVWYEWSIWTECRATNSFFYCLRVLSH